MLKEVIVVEGSQLKSLFVSKKRMMKQLSQLLT